MISFCVLLVVAACVKAFQVEPWYANLHEFGPTRNSGWEARAMTLVGDFEFAIGPLDVLRGDQFMFVQKLVNVTLGPLGELNWKQGKLGVSVAKRLYKSIYFADLIAGGGGGRYPVTGMCRLRVFTPSHPTKPNTVELHFANHSVASRLEATSFVVDSSNSSTATVTLIADSTAIDLTTRSMSSTATATLSSAMWRNSSPPTSADEFAWLADVAAPATGEGVVALDVADAHVELLFTRNVLRGARWLALHRLRDRTDAMPQSRPADGWSVTPIHMSVVALASGVGVVVTGFRRRDAEPCRGGANAGGRRSAGVSFIIGADELARLRTRDDVVGERVIDVAPLDERADFVFGAQQSSTFEERVIDGDAIYCAGHTQLADGRVLYAGGARYANISSPFEFEFGLDYLRIFAPQDAQFQRANSSFNLPFGRSWYPTTLLLPDGLVLVTGGFSDYGTSKCFAEACHNPQIALMNVSSNASSPWTIIVDKSINASLINPGVREYTRAIVLPTPIVANGLLRHVLLMGEAGVAVLLSLNTSIPMSERLYVPPNGARALRTEFIEQCDRYRSEQSSATPIILDNELFLLVANGCGASRQVMQQIDVYSVRNDSWQSFDSGIPRLVAATLLLADGTVLLINGEPSIDQAACESRFDCADTRLPQIYDPYENRIYTDARRAEDEPFRGYHNSIALLDDGSVLVGGGFNFRGDVGCESPTLRIYEPDYLHRGPRPTVVSIGESTTFATRARRTLCSDASVVELHATRPAALLAATSFTHSYAQSQRYVPLIVVDRNATCLTVDVPEAPRLVPGPYMLHLLSTRGVPSLGVAVRVALGVDDDPWRVDVDVATKLMPMRADAEPTTTTATLSFGAVVALAVLAMFD